MTGVDSPDRTDSVAASCPARRLLKSRGRVPILVGTGLLVAAAAAALVLSQPLLSRPAGGYACMRELPGNGVDDDPGYCDRLVGDASRRRALSQDQRDAAAAGQRRAEQALDQFDWCVKGLPPQGAECDGLGSVGPDAGPAAVASLVRALRNAGFADATVRLAEPDDPAVRGSIYFAIPVTDAACFVGNIQSARGGGSQRLVGRLPNGRC
jgi:hypothetical protein